MPHSQQIVASLAYGAMVNYTCDKGFEFELDVPYMEVYCVGIGTWNVSMAGKACKGKFGFVYLFLSFMSWSNTHLL